MDILPQAPENLCPLLSDEMEGVAPKVEIDARVCAI